MIKQNFLKSQNNLLAHQTVIPDKNPKSNGVIFVHAADGNRLGPHRMFVELQRKLNKAGFPTIRFDFSGCGDSTGKITRNNIQYEIYDLLAVAEFFKKKAKLLSISLFGISRGARISFETLCKYNLNVTTAVLLSSPAPTSKAAVKSFSYQLGQYLYKLKDPQKLRKLLFGKADIKQITKTFTTALKLKRRYSAKPKNAASQCPLLFIYAENDPIRTDAEKFYKNICTQLGLPFNSKIIKDANHSFFHYKWKEKIIDITENWLKDCSK